MKRIEIPLIERNNNISENDSVIKIYESISINSIYNKYLNGESFTNEDLIVLYDIYGFLYYQKGKLYSKTCSQSLLKKLEKKQAQIKNSRNYQKDLAVIFDCGIDEIGNNKEELDSNPDKYVILLGSYGRQYLCCCLEHRYSKLKYINGDVYLNLTSNYNNNFPSLEVIGGDAYLSFENADGFENLKSFCNSIDWNNLKDTSHLKKLEYIGGNAKFRQLPSAEGLENLKYVGGSADFESLISSKGLDGLREIKYVTSFRNLSDIDYFNSLEQIPDNYWIMDYILKEELKTKVLKRR